MPSVVVPGHRTGGQGHRNQPLKGVSWRRSGLPSSQVTELEKRSCPRVSGSSKQRQSAEGHSIAFEAFEWGCDYYERTGRMMPKDGLQQIAGLRRDLPGRDRLAERAGPGIPVGTADADPTRLPPIREPSAGAALQGRADATCRQGAGLDRFPDRAGEQRGRIFRDRRAPLCRHGRGNRRPAGDLHAPRHRPHFEICVRAGRHSGRAAR